MLTDFQNFFSARFASKYATKSSLTIRPHLKRVAALSCKTSISENSENLKHISLSTTNHKVVYMFECGGLFSNHFATDLLLSLLVKQFLKSMNIGEVTGKTTYHTQKHFAAISFLLCHSRCVQTYCGNFSMATLYII